MTVSKAWEWSLQTDPVWLEPSEESYYLSRRWRDAGFRRLLDFGCGLGRHSVYFAREGFTVSSFDLSEQAVGHLSAWAQKEGLSIAVDVADMLALPYPPHSFDCVFAYHVVSHTDSRGITPILSQIHSLLKPDGEVFLTLCSKDTWSFKDAGYPRLDANTVVKTDDGPEKGVPHFYVELDDIPPLFSGFDLLRVRHTDDCWFCGRKQNSKHYFILATPAD